LKNSCRKVLIVLAILLALSVQIPAAFCMGNDDLFRMARENFAPLPKKPVFDRANRPNVAKLRLGKLLYFDRRLSLSGNISCNNCHDLAKRGIDSMAYRLGHEMQKLPRNTPTVFNSTISMAMFRDGRKAKPEDMAQETIRTDNRKIDKSIIVGRIVGVPEYVSLFIKAFPKKINKSHEIDYLAIADALGVYLRTLLAPAPFDRYLANDQSAISENAKKGLLIFIEKGCAKCHNGAGVGGGLYRRLDNSEQTFKVPSLRDVVNTAPYFHDGSVKSLKAAVTHSGSAGSSLPGLDNEDIDHLLSFLAELTSEIYPPSPPVLP
jgi:cytochrome c peroxidase